jgi:hypothetical protein
VRHRVGNALTVVVPLAFLGADAEHIRGHNQRTFGNVCGFDGGFDLRSRLRSIDQVLAHQLLISGRRRGLPYGN